MRVYVCTYILKGIGPQKDFYSFKIYLFISFLQTCMFPACCTSTYGLPKVHKMVFRSDRLLVAKALCATL